MNGFRFYTAILAIIFQGCVSKQLPEHDLLLLGVNVVDVKDGAIHYNKAVVISNGRIFSVVAADELPDAKYRVRLDLSGKYLIPGMWDMHAHPDDPEMWRMDPSDEEKDLMLPLFVINGVTGIRDMGGDIALVNRWRQMGEAGRLLVPKIFAGGPLLDGPNPMWDGSVGIKSPDEVPRVVDSLIDSGVDFLKIYSLLPRDTYFAIASYADSIDFPFVGHVPYTVKPSECAVTGMKSQEHLLEILKETVKNNEGLLSLRNIEDRFERFRAINEYLIENFDQEKMDSLNHLFVENRIWHTPTLSMWYKNAWFEEEVIRDDSLIDYLPGYVKKYWTIGVNDHLNFRDEEAYIQTNRKLFSKYKDLTRDMHEAGVKLLAGTDMGANPLCFPGTGVHNELKMFVSSGLTTAEALRTATINPAEFFGIEEDYGSIENGKVADIVVLDKNPLNDISHVSAIYAVIQEGKLISSDSIWSVSQMILSENN